MRTPLTLDDDLVRALSEKAYKTGAPFGFVWIVILGFLRIVTKVRIMPMPLSSKVALETVDDWLRQMPSVIVVPSQRHGSVLKELLMTLGTAANLTSDARLAALAIENGARL